MSNISVLKKPEIVPQADIIEKLEEMLADARSGEMKGFIAVCDHGEKNRMITSGVPDRYRLLGYTVTLQHELLGD